MDPVKGIAFKIGSVLVFICMSAMIKATSAEVPPGEAVFFRSFFAIPVILGWLWWRGDLSTGLRVQARMAHFWRGLIGTCAMGFGFSALGFLPLPDVTAIGYATPLLVVIFAAMFLGEDVRAFRLGAVALGLTGVLIILAPKLTLLESGAVMQGEAIGAILVLIAAVFASLAAIHVRQMVKVEQTSAIVFYFSATASLLGLATLPFGWVVPTAFEAALLIMAGLLGGLGQIFLTSAYRHADASVVAPFDYSSMLFAVLIGYFIFDEVPTLRTLLGGAIVILAGVLIIWREHALGLKREKSRQGMTPQG